MRGIKREDYPVGATNANTSCRLPLSQASGDFSRDREGRAPRCRISTAFSLPGTKPAYANAPPLAGEVFEARRRQNAQLQWSSFNTPRSSRGDSPLRFAPLKGGILGSRVIAPLHHRRQRKLSALILFFSVLSARSALRCRERRGPSPAALLF